MAVKFFGNNIDSFFGFDVGGSKPRPGETIVLSPLDPERGSTVVDQSWNPIIDQSLQPFGERRSVFRNEIQMVSLYREMSLHPLVDRAITAIIDTMFVFDSEQPPVSINLDEINASDKVKKFIAEAWEELYKTIRFSERGHEIAKNWYINGKVYHQILVDTQNLKRGIVGIRYIDPRQIKKITKVDLDRNINTVPLYDETKDRKPLHV